MILALQSDHGLIIHLTIKFVVPQLFLFNERKYLNIEYQGVKKIVREYKELMISTFEDIIANYYLYMWPRGWCDNIQTCLV